jgi:DNA repair protein RecO (recombination protein O)
MALDLLDAEDSPTVIGRGLAEFELVLLDELGFGLDLTSCAATGVTEELAYVSPKSGRAVSRGAAEPYLDRLLRLPAFLIDGTAPRDGDIADALRLTGHFLDLHVWMARNIDPPAMREGLVRLLEG